MGTIGARGLYSNVFNNFTGGWNTNDGMKIRRNEVQVAKNVRLHDGIRSRFGSLALTSQPWTTTIDMFDTYIEVDGTEHLIVMEDHKIWDVNTSTGTRTERYDLISGSNNGKLVNYLGKGWMATGSRPLKIESNLNVYPIGIDAPTTGSASISAGGTLPDGTYDVYIAYARKVSSVNVLYSGGKSLGSVVLSSGNNTIDITSFGNSSDLQVNNKVVFLKDTDEVIYQYYETDDNTTTSISITSDTQKDSTILYDDVSRYNIDVPDFEYVFVFKNRLFGSVNNTLYYSLRNSNNVWDIERFLVDGYYELPSKVLGMFSLQGNLYVNTILGIIVFPNGEMDNSYEELTTERFLNIESCVEHNSMLWGLTQYNGVKPFDGATFKNYIISQNIPNEIGKIYSNFNTYRPRGLIRNVNGRTEYHLSYNDTDVAGLSSHNAKLVLDLTGFQFLENGKTVSPYTYHTNGASYMTLIGNTLFSAQRLSTGSIIYKELKTSTVDNGIYLQNGTLGTSESSFERRVDTRVEKYRLDAFLKFNKLRTLVQTQGEIKIYLLIGENESISDEEGVSSNQDVLIWDSGFWDDEVWAQDRVQPTLNKLSYKTKGRTYFLRIVMNGDDIDSYLQEVEIFANYIIKRSF